MPAADTVAVHVAVGTEPVGVTDVTDGDVPPVPEVAGGVKFAVVTFLTGSLNVTVQCNDDALVGFASARAMDATDGAVESTIHEYEAEDEALPPETACTWKV